MENSEKKAGAFSSANAGPVEPAYRDCLAYIDPRTDTAPQDAMITPKRVSGSFASGTVLAWRLAVVAVVAVVVGFADAVVDGTDSDCSD